MLAPGRGLRYFAERGLERVDQHGRVRRGSITPSTQLRSAAAWICETLLVVGDELARRASDRRPRELALKTMLTAPSGPITAPVGHAVEVRADVLRAMTSYVPLYALRVITVSFGTVASAYAYSSLAPWR